MTDELNLEPGTIEIIRHFEPIAADGTGCYAGGLVITSGNVIRVSNKLGRLVARATVPQTFERGWAFYNVGRFLGAIGPFKNPKLTFRDGYMLVTDTDPTETGLSVRYPICRPDMITSVDADPEFEPELAFALSKDNLKTILDIATNLGLPNIVIAGQAGKLQLGALDVLKPQDGKMGAKLTIGKSERNFTLAFLATDFRKIKPDDYKVAVGFRPDSNREGGIRTVSTDERRHYWILSQTAPGGPAAQKARNNEED